MRLWLFLRDPLLAGLVWGLLAIASVAVRDQAGAVLLLWMPSGVAVAAFYATREHRWPLLAAILLPLQAVAIHFTGTPPFEALIYSAATLVQAAIAAALGVWVLGSRDGIPRTFSHIVGLFGAAMIGCLVGAAVAIPFRAEQTLTEFTWWFLSNVIGILTVAPIVAHLRQLMTARGKPQLAGSRWEAFFSLAAFSGLTALVLNTGPLPFAPLLIGGIVMITFRYGHLVSSVAVLVFGFVATGLSLGGQNPIAYAGMTIREATIVLQCWMLVMLATSLPVASMLLKREELQHELLRRNANLHENLMLLDLGEQLAGIGRWRLNLETGEQDWSVRMLEIHGLSAELAPDPGNVRDLMPDGGEALFNEIARRRDEREPFSFDYRVKPRESTERVLRISILNEFDATGKRVAVFGVAIDVTEQVHREQALVVARGRAVRLAAEAQKLANTDSLTNLPNRRCTFGRLASMVDVASKRGSQLTAIVFDIDHFKSVNDTYGHQTGDEVIVQVAEVARRQARAGDVVGRIGGEEFVWLLPGFDIERARPLAERLRQSVENGVPGSTLPNVTISLGLAEFRRGDTAEELLARADAALYEAKDLGRNQVRDAA